MFDIVIGHRSDTYYFQLNIVLQLPPILQLQLPVLRLLGVVTQGSNGGYPSLPHYFNSLILPPLAYPAHPCLAAI